MTRPITVISSMATRQILHELTATYSRNTGQAVEVQSVGGADAVRRLRAGEAFDLVVLASDAMKALLDDGPVIGDSICEFARSPTAMAVPVGAPHPATCDEAAIKSLVSSVQHIGVSTGPSGTNIAKLLTSWGLFDKSDRRIVQAPPGVPVARLLSNGDADVGFQQLSELLGQPGIEIVGTVPMTLQPMTIFTCCIGRRAADGIGARSLLSALLSDDTAATKRKNGMEPGEAKRSEVGARPVGKT